MGVGDPLLFDHPVRMGLTTPRGPGRSPELASSGAALPAPEDLFRNGQPDIDLLRQLPSLPETALELESMRSHFPHGDLLLRAEASEQAVRFGTDLSQYGVIAFATHGLVAGELPNLAEPGLVLTPPSQPDGSIDGLLTASEIAQLNLDADWVILSACNTAAADGTPGAEGLSGLARAFFFAGARSLFVSHWAVASEPTVELTTRMLRDAAVPGVSRASAHRSAVLHMLSSGNGLFSHPTIWAPFVVVGEGGQPAPAGA